MQWVQGFDEWCFIGDGSGDVSKVHVTRTDPPRIVANPSFSSHQLVETSIVCLEFPDTFERERARHLVMSRHEAEHLIERLRWAVDALSQNKRLEIET